MNDNVGMHPGASSITAGTSSTTAGTSSTTAGASSTTAGASSTTAGTSSTTAGASSITAGTSSTTAGASSTTAGASSNNELPEGMFRRKNIRATFHNYSGGDYFVTICTQNKEQFFGKIRNNEMLYSPIGAEAYRCMETLASHYQYVEVPLFVIMPNHVHAIIRIREQEDAPGCIPTIRTALGVVVGGYKQSVTRFARRNNIEFDWQSRYHDHIIRGTYDGNRIADYIQNNVASWANDCFYE